MPSCLVYYGTSEGQTKKIAMRVAEHLRARGVTVDVVESPADVDPSRFDAVVIGDSIHIGRHHRHVLKFIQAHRTILEAIPTAFFSVCLGIASKNESDRENARHFIDDMVERTGWRPDRVAVFAGALKYSRYGLLTRFIMKKISASEGQSTDTKRDYEYTDWDAVAAFSTEFAEVLAAHGKATPAQAVR